MERLDVILDTDMENEIDDQYALVYLLKSLDRFKLKAVTIAPFFGSKYGKVKDIEDGVNQSYDTTLKIMDMLKYNHKDIVYKGSTEYMQNGYNVMSDAVSKIIEIVKSNNKKIYVLGIGAITNIALAIQNDPSIINNMEVIWLGGNSFLYNKNDEFNFKQDIKAVKTVFESGVKLTVIPCRNVASHMITTIYELEHYLLDKGEIGKFLCKIFDECKPREPGMSKTLWDLSVIGYLINKDWFKEEEIYCPSIDDNGDYIMNDSGHKAVFVKDIMRNHIYGDFFKKMGD